MFFLRKISKKPGWLALNFQSEGICLAHILRITDRKPAVTLCKLSEGGETDTPRLEKLAKELRLEQYQCTTLLKAKEYQMLLVEAPNVPNAELKTAIRWRVKDMLDYPVDEATFDVLDIPPEQGALTKSHSMYAIAAPNKVIQQRQAQFEQARIPLRAIDVMEMAQRNISALMEPEQRGLAMLSFDSEGGLLTITYSGELYLSRRVDVSARQLIEADPQQKAVYHDRITLEMQRSLDHFDRQFHFITLAKLLLAPMQGVEGLREYLSANMYVPVEILDLADVFDFSAVPELVRQERQSLYFATLGAALRLEEILA